MSGRPLSALHEQAAPQGVSHAQADEDAVWTAAVSVQGDTRAVPVEGPSREAIELVEDRSDDDAGLHLDSH